MWAARCRASSTCGWRIVATQSCGGQPLAPLESGVENAEEALAEIRAANECELQARKTDLKLAELELARSRDLHRQDTVPAQQVDESRARYQIAHAPLTRALQNQELQQLESKRAQRLYAKRILTSPVDGVVVAQLAFAGEFVCDNPVMRVVALDPLRVEVMLPARLFATIKVGDTARLYPELGSDAPLFSTVDVVDAMLD